MKGSPQLGGGTWVHPYIAIQLAQWCNPKFAVQVSKWVIEWMTTGQTPIERSQPNQLQTPPSKPTHILPPNFVEADLSHEDQHYQYLKQLGQREINKRFLNG